MKSLPSLEQLNKLFTYDKETGALTNKTVNKYSSNAVVGGDAGCIGSTGHRVVRIDGSGYKPHRICYFIGTGVEPEQIDHINGVRDDNRLCNLRSVSHIENHRNKKKPNNNTSGSVGVYHHKETGKWTARLGDKYLGFFADKIDAIYARHYAQADANYHTNHGR